MAEEVASKFKSFLSRSDAESWAKEVFSNWKNSLSVNEVKAIEEYSGAAYGNINAVLRGYEPSFIGNNAQYADDLANALNRSNIPQDIRLFRGTSKDMLGSLKNLSIDDMIGKTISDEAFLSTSLIKESSFGGDLLLKIDAPAVSKGAFIGDLSAVPSEVEVLLQKGQDMIIKDAFEVNGVLELVVEIIN